MKYPVGHRLYTFIKYQRYFAPLTGKINALQAVPLQLLDTAMLNVMKSLLVTTKRTSYLA